MVDGKEVEVRLLTWSASSSFARAKVVGGDILESLRARLSSKALIELFGPSLPKHGVSWIASRSVSHLVTLVLDPTQSIATCPRPSLIQMTATRSLGLCSVSPLSLVRIVLPS